MSILLLTLYDDRKVADFLALNSLSLGSVDYDTARRTLSGFPDPDSQKSRYTLTISTGETLVLHMVRSYHSLDALLFDWRGIVVHAAVVTP